MAKGLKKIQQQMMIDNMLSGRGVDKGNFRFDMTPLEDIVTEFIENVKSDINSINDFVTTGSIENLYFKVNNLNEYEVYGMEHLIYQSRGVNGTQDKSQYTPHAYTTLKPPVAPIIEWIKNKKLITRNNSKFFADPIFDDMTDDEKIQQLAFAIRQTIFKKGYKGHGYWDRNTTLLQQEINNRLGNNLADQIKYRIYNKYGDNVHKKL